MPIPSFDNCYWVVPGQFLAGEYPGNHADETARVRLAALLAAGVRAFIDLTAPDDGLRPYAPLLRTPPLLKAPPLAAPIELAAPLIEPELIEARPQIFYQRFSIQDVSVPHSRAFTSEILEAIDAHLAAGRMVYVHCWGGVGRTGVIVGCWLARHGHPGPAALARLRQLWQTCPKSANRRSPETREQEQYLIDFAT